ncbi:hypothetical protein FDUTEX481_01504 [Tolypothrix sp. PCC 7601]|nr:hypothetical protein FDUTEX481_01504 [Tolypothrix sp. PCC 7601]BAY91580.1 hypothetical protein NIES3275_36040 [Microchaete diplosiphon NIES-3275]
MTIKIFKTNNLPKAEAIFIKNNNNLFLHIKIAILLKNYSPARRIFLNQNMVNSYYLLNWLRFMIASALPTLW